MSMDWIDADAREASCGYDVGDPPDSCRCLLPRNHMGLHRCKHAPTPPEDHPNRSEA